MAAQIQMSNIFKSLGNKLADAHNAAKDIPVNTGGGSGLPDGIKNGIAQLKVMEFIEGKKVEDKGKFYFRAAGVVVSPIYHEGIKTGGKQTYMLIPFFDTPNRQKKKFFVEHHWADYRDFFEKMGVSQPPPQQSGENKDATSARIQKYYQTATEILLKQAPHFEFHTWKGEKATSGPYKDKEPGVNETWGGKTEFVPTGAAANPAAGVGPAAPAASTAPLQPEPFTEPPQAAPAASPPPPSVADVPINLTKLEMIALAETADADADQETDDGKDAVKTLSLLCKQYGVMNEEAATVPNWVALVDIIDSRKTGAAKPVEAPAPTPAPSAPAAPATPRAAPAKGDVVGYNGQQCEVSSVNVEARIVTLKGPDKKAVVGADKKLLKVGFDQLT